MNVIDILIDPSDDDDSILDTYEFGCISSEDEIIIVENNPTEKVWWW